MSFHIVSHLIKFKKFIYFMKIYYVIIMEFRHTFYGKHSESRKVNNLKVLLYYKEWLFYDPDNLKGVLWCFFRFPVDSVDCRIVFISSVKVTI